MKLGETLELYRGWCVIMCEVLNVDPLMNL